MSIKYNFKGIINLEVGNCSGKQRFCLRVYRKLILTNVGVNETGTITARNCTCLLSWLLSSLWLDG